MMNNFMSLCFKHSKAKVLLFSAAAAVFVGGCDMTQNLMKADRGNNMEMQDFKDAFAPRDPEISDDSLNLGAPDLQPYVSGNIGAEKPMPLVSVSVNQTVPIRDILFELAQQADYDIELDPNIRGSIIYTARNRPLDEVVDRISDLAGLRYDFKGDVLRVEVDTAYGHIYKIDFINYVRSVSSQISNDVSVVSGDGADTGSNFSASSTSETDFWAELETNLAQILGNAGGVHMRTNSDPRITSVEQSAGANVATSAAGEPEAVLRVDSLPISDSIGGGGAQEAAAYSFALNKQAGLVNVFANRKAHKQIADYLAQLKRSATAQVLIEAKILEVSLNDEFSAGIDWSTLKLLGDPNSVLQFGSTDGVSARPTLSSITDSSNFAVGFLGDDISAIVQALQGFGTTTALASPRLTVLNNQAAVLNVATNVVYFEIDIDRTEGTDGAGDTVEIDSEIKNVPEGVLVNVQPAIDLDTDTITLSLRPTITRIVRQVSDPAVLFVAGNTGIESTVPELNVQEIDSLIKVRSGQPIVLGGLLQDETSTTQTGAPGLSEVPVFGNLFKKKSDKVSKTELVILLKATIIDAEDTIHDTDKDFYRTFAKDRRPFKL